MQCKSITHILRSPALCAAWSSVSPSCYRSAHLQVGIPAVARLLHRLLRPSRSGQVCRGRLCITPVPIALLIGLSQGRAICIGINDICACLSVASTLGMLRCCQLGATLSRWQTTLPGVGPPVAFARCRSAFAPPKRSQPVQSTLKQGRASVWAGDLAIADPACPP